MNRYLFSFFVLASIILQAYCEKHGTGYNDHCEVIYVEYGHYDPYQDFIPVNQKITYYCDPDYDLKGYKELVCLPSGWNHPPPECNSKISTETCERQLVELENGDIDQPEGDRPLNPGERIWYKCNIYYNLVGAQDVTCMDNGEWNYPPPTCEPAYIPCSPREPPAYGSQSPYQESYKFGEKVYYTCNDGYQLYGAEKTICTQHGTWSYPIPICKPRTCRSLNKPDNGNFSPQLLNYKIGVQAHFTCSRNFRLVGEEVLVCQNNGQWSSDEPECERIGCQPVDAPDNGSLNPEKDLYDVDDKVYFQCDDNFVLSGTSPIVCLESEEFSDDVPTCVPQQCTRPTLDNGNFEEDKVIYDVGDVVEFICDEGFELSGRDTIRCKGNGQWSHAFPQCIPIQCDRPAFDNGSLDADKDFYDYQEPVTFTCNPGYIISGSEVVACVGSNEWSDEFPICIAVQCPRLPFDNGVVIEDKESYDVGETIFFECNTGYTLEGAANVDCQEDGAWSDEYPLCVANQCTRPILDNGQLDEDKPLYNVGEVVDFSCDEGYVLQGAESLTCEASSQWSGDFPVCVPVTCARPGFDNGELTDDKQYYGVGEVVGFACFEGFVQVGVTQATCLSTGDFSDEIPQCIPITCTRPDIENSILFADHPTYGFNDVVLVRCEPGFVLQGESELQCIGDEEWSQEFPSCVPIQCERPDFEGELNEDKDVYDIGEEVHFSCPTGSILKGRRKLTCLQNGQFSGRIPFCKRRTCITPTIDNGDFGEKQDDYFPGSVVEFECNENFYLDGEQTLRCQNNGQWNFDFPTCREHLCEQPNILNGGFNPVQDSYVLQTTVNFFCDEGFSLVGREEVTCLLEGHWSHAFPTCAPNTCVEPFIENGEFEEVRDVYSVGDDVSFTCNDGYSIVGVAAIVCEPNGQWSDDFPTCEAVRCDKPELNDGVTITPNQNSYGVGQSVTYSCPRGNTLIGEEDAECLSNGEFSNGSPDCQENMCEQPNIDNGSFDPIQASYDVRDKVTFQCDDGFVLVGEQTVRCRYDGSWSADFPICEPVTCEVPTIDDGSFGPVQDVYSFQDEVTFSCDDGFTLRGARVIRCLADGRWSEEFPTCAGNQCGRPVQNSNIVRISPSRPLYDVGVVVTFTCRRGFALQGSKTSVCQEDGSWSPVEPTCKRIVFCKIRTRPRYTILQPRRYKYAVGQTVTVTCRRGYKLVGKSLITCQSNGKFTPKLPTCSRPSRRCKKPFVSSKTIVSPNEKYYESGQSITFSCMAPYAISEKESDTAKCVNGRWSNSVPSCLFQSNQSCEGRCKSRYAYKPCFCHKYCKYKSFQKKCCKDYKEYCLRS